MTRDRPASSAAPSASTYERPFNSFVCVLCGATTARRWRGDGRWTVVRCGECGLLATWPQPDDAALAAIYDSPDYHGTRSCEDPGAWLARARDVLGSVPSTGGRVLDFGAGQGRLVRAARELGVQMDGVEPSETARQYARSVYGIELVPELSAVPGHAYTMVTMLHVLEHVRDPVACLREIRSHLAHGGFLFVEVPHAASADMWFPRWRALILDLPAHLHHFTPETLERVLRTAGYEVIEVKLFNAAVIERVLARRRPRPAGPAEPADRGEPAGHGSAPRGSTMGGAWKRLLAASRAVLPGGKFQVVARRSE